MVCYFETIEYPFIDMKWGTKDFAFSVDSKNNQVPDGLDYFNLKA